MPKPLVEKECLLQKFPGKGGWTLAEIPEIQQDKNTPFGWVKVKGRIDDYKISNFNLAPRGNGNLFLPVKAEIRKRIGKQAGDYVKIILYADTSLFEIPQEIIDCLQVEESAYQKFMQLKERHQKEFVNWICAVKRMETRANRINFLLDKLMQGKTLYEKTDL